MTRTYRAGVFGASGYPGAELLRYLAGHPSIEVAWVTAHGNAGKPLGEVFGHLGSFGDLVLQPSDPDAAPELEVAFLALPHGAAATTGRALAARGVKVVDFSADWRLHDGSAYEEWYGWTHPFPADLAHWTYGLPELHRAEISAASTVANPGCYPTAAILAVRPALQDGAISADHIVIDAVSGISGAGRKTDVTYSFCELDASAQAYGVGTHRHTPEIEQELGIHVTFAPHLVPMARGLLATCYARADAQAVRDALEVAYKDEPFVHVVTGQPGTKQVSGSNHALIGVAGDARNGLAVITCAIDNLGKGAAGQAIQNANLMLGLDESAGLGALGVYP